MTFIKVKTHYKKRPYAESGKRRYTKGGKIKQEKKKANNIIYSRNIPTTNNPKYIIPNSTKLDPNPVDFKNNHRNQCLETQKIWILNPSQASH